MPKIMNGHAAGTPVETPELKAAQELLTAFRNTWVAQLSISGIDQVRFSQLSVVALSQLAAIVGVDVGMPLENFLKVCEANFKEAYSRAPKFG